MTLAEAKRWKNSADPSVRREARAVLAAAKARAARTKPKRQARLDAEAREERRVEAHRRKVYRDVDMRAGNLCEEVNGVIECCNPGAEHDHFFGRGKAKESLETAWLLCRFHHDQKTLNDPSRLTWLERFKIHAQRYRYREVEAMCDRAMALERAQHPTKEAP